MRNVVTVKLLVLLLEPPHLAVVRKQLFRVEETFETELL